MTTPVRKPTLFEGLDRDTAREIAALGTSRVLLTGRSLFSLGDDASELYVVERGRIALTLPMEIGERDRDLPIDERRAGDIVGWSAVVPPYRFTLSAHAEEDSQVLALPREALLDYCVAHPQTGRVLTANVTAVIGHLLNVFQTMWLREVNRSIQRHVAAQEWVRP